MRPGTSVFVDTGAWIALALTRDPLHDRASQTWDRLGESGAKIVTSIPVVLETFTFLDRNARRTIAIDWRESLGDLKRLSVLECSRRDLEGAWPYFDRPDLHKLSAVDATSFAVMRRAKIRHAFAFDHHFTQVGFVMV